MKHGTQHLSVLALLLGFAANAALGQSNQIGQPVNGSVAGINGTSLTIFGTTGPSCGVLNYRFTMADPSAPWGSTYGTIANYYSLPAGKGQQSFNVAFTYASDNTATPNYDVFVDGQYCPSCTATLNSHSISGIPGITDISIQDYLTQRFAHGFKQQRQIQWCAAHKPQYKAAWLQASQNGAGQHRWQCV